MRLRHCLVIVAMLAPVGIARADILSKCIPLVFSISGDVTVHEHIPGFAPLCYSFRARSGQNAKIMVTRNNKMGFSIVYDRPGDNLTLAVTADVQTYKFETEAKTYRILVASSDLHVSKEPYFTLTASLK